MSTIVTDQKFDMIEIICSKILKDHPSLHQKCALLRENSECANFLKNHRDFEIFLESLKPEILVIALSILAIGQGKNIFKKTISCKDKEKIIALLNSLIPVEEFYQPIGGLIGYHYAVLSRLQEKAPDLSPSTTYLRPKGIDISKMTPQVCKYVRAAIEKSHIVAEVYPVGGAGDRMDLVNESGEPLPAAVLSFCGHTLLDRLIRDVEAREYLVYKLTGKRLETKIGLMTSFEKRNDDHIRANLQKKNWFGRPKHSFYLFTQGQVPVLDNKGNWLLKEPYKLIFKPGGHGVLWGQAVKEGLFSAFKESGIQKILVRQINNPVAGTDHGLLAFLGYGLKNNKMFGFASCERIVNANEGMDVVAEKQKSGVWNYALTNIEYTEFKRIGVQDIPKSEGSPYSKFPTNTNILFADIAEIENKQKECRIPGMTINMKTKFKAIDESGKLQEVLGGRLESTMQNIADAITDTFTHKISELDQDKLKSYLTYNDRIKTISVTKKAWCKGESLLETAEGCFLDMMKNAQDLLGNYCHFHLPKIDSKEEPSFVFLYHPSLGPLYEIIQQKIRKGTIAKGSELIIETPEVDIEGLNLEGSLIVACEVDHPLQGKEAKCRLKNVQVVNKGISLDIGYWKEQKRRETLQIILEEGAEFEAENVRFTGSVEIRVPKNTKAKAFIENGKVAIKQGLAVSDWSWRYAFDNQDRIILSM